MPRSKVGKEESQAFDAAIFALQYNGALKTHIATGTPPPSYFKHSAFDDQDDENIDCTYVSAFITFRNKIVPARLKKFSALADLFQVDLQHPDGWKMLALLLAVKHVPGFKVVTKKTKPRKWTTLSKFEFLMGIEHLRRKHQCDKSTALVLLAKDTLAKNGMANTKPNTYVKQVAAKLGTLKVQHSRFSKDPSVQKLIREHDKQESERRKKSKNGYYLITSHYAGKEVCDTRELYLPHPFYSWDLSIKVPVK